MIKLSPKFYFISGVFLLALFCFGLLWTATTVNPQDAALGGLILMYFFVFTTSLSVFALSSYALRVRFSKNRPLRLFARVSVRQGALFAALVVILLFLQSMRSVTLLSAGLLIISLSLLEVAFLSR